MIIDTDTCDFGFCRQPAETLLLRIAGQVAEVRPMCSKHLADAETGDAANIRLRRLILSANGEDASLDLIPA